MAENINEMHLEQKLAKLQEIVDVAKKNKKGYNYSYADINEILAKLTAGMKKYKVNLHPSIVPQTGRVEQLNIVNTKFDKQGKPYNQAVYEMLVTADMNYKWVNIDNPEESIEVPWFVAGSQSDPSQALGSGLTYGKRQFLTNYFHIALVEEDIEQYRKKQKEAAIAEDKEIAREIIDNFDGLVKEYLSNHKDKSKDVKAFIGNYAKESNYFSIKDSATAAKLLQDFTNTYLNNEE